MVPFYGCYQCLDDLSQGLGTQCDKPIGGVDCSDYLGSALAEDVGCRFLHFVLGGQYLGI